MIKTLTIQNIQSHKESTLEFNQGINAIVGSSNNGKSAILRALYWVRYNRPLGVDTLLSHWAFDDKGNQKFPMQVTVENENGIVTRRRTKDENQYIINDEELNIVKSDVPEKVERILALSDTNIQRQQDTPFLLSLTSGQVAQYFNKTVRLDVIDRVLSNVESKRRKMNQELNQLNCMISDKEELQEKYSWIDDVEKLLTKYENLSEKCESLGSEIEYLQEQIGKFNYFSSMVEKFESISDSKKLIDKITDMDSKVDSLNSEIESIQGQIFDFETCNSSLYPSFDEVKKIIDLIFKIDVSDIDSDIEHLTSQIQDIESCEKIIKGCELNIKELKKQLPDICPICGARMKDGKCIKE